MSKRIKREVLIRALESVRPGLASKEVIEQSTCFVFLDGDVVTYNDELSCRMPVGLDVEGPVSARPLSDILNKYTEEEVELEQRNGEILIKGKNKRTGIPTDKTIALPVDNVEQPDKWKPLPHGFLEAATMALACAGTDENRKDLTCVHFSAGWIESSDGYQMVRYDLDLPLKKDFMLRRESVAGLLSGSPMEIAETESWVHFRSENGLVVSCRRYADDYEDLSPHLDVEGKKIELPQGLKDSLDKAEVFSKDNPDDNILEVRLRPGQMMLKATGMTGWHEERKEVKYQGPELGFLVPPTVFRLVLDRHDPVVINEKRLAVRGENYRYVSCLRADPSKNGKH